MAYHFRNLVFEGGGVKGIAYVGALEVLDREGILKDIKRVAGTSAGAMIAVLVGLGFSAEELRKILWDIDFNNFMDDTWGVIRDTKRLIKEYGWYKGDFFRNLMAGYVKEKTGNGEATFREVETMRLSGKPFRDISLIGSDLSTGVSRIFSAQFTPDVKVADAARISMSIPLIFSAVKGVKGDKHIYVDGGLLDNYYIKVFDRSNYIAEADNARRTDYYDQINAKMVPTKSLARNTYVYNKETLGFRLDSREEIDMYLNPDAEPKPKEIKNLLTYTKALVGTLIDFQNNVHLHSDDWQRTVYIDTLGVKSIDFGLPDEKKTALLNSGRSHTEAYLEWYNNDEEKANK